MRKAPGRGQGAWLTAPSFELKMDPRMLIGGILDSVSLGGFSLVNPIVTFNRESDTLTGEAIVRIPTKYPAQFDLPTDVRVRISSSKLGRFTGEASYGPLLAELRLSLEYDSAPLEQALSALGRRDLAGAAGNLAEVSTEGRISASGSAGIGTSKLKVPTTVYGGSADIGEGGVQARGGAAGLIGLPAGTFHPDLAVPAAGAAGGLLSFNRAGEGTSAAGFAGVTGTPSLQAISKMDLGNAFEPFAYAQVTFARRTAKGHEFSLKLSAQLPIGAQPGQPNALDSMRAEVSADRQRLRGNTRDLFDPAQNIDPAVRSRWAGMQAGPEGGSGANLVLTGTFDLLGSR